MLAAGGSLRMGAPKQLLRLGGETLVARVCAAAEASVCRRVFVVLGAEARAVEEALAGRSATRVVNPDWRSGLASSIRAGVRAALAAEDGEGARWDGLLIALADQPDASRQVFDALASRLRPGDPLAIVASRYDGALGVPALFGRAHFDALLGLTGDEGARRLLDARRDAVVAVPFAAGAVDVDTPADYRALLERDARDRGDDG